MKIVVPLACLFLALTGPASAQDQDAVSRCFLVAIDDVAVPAPEAGILMSIEVEEGDSVSMDQPLAHIDDRQAQMARSVAKNEYYSAKKKAENQISVEAAQKSQLVAKAELDTALDANRKVSSTYSETEVRRLRLTEERSGLQIELARFELVVAFLDARAKLAQYEQADAMIERRKIKAPHAGVVDKILLNKGNWVQPGDPVMSVVRMDQLRVQGRVSSKKHSWSDVLGRDVEVTVQLPGGGEEMLRAKITFASQSVGEDESFRVHADIENRQENGHWLMGPGLDASMRFVGL